MSGWHVIHWPPSSIDHWWGLAPPEGTLLVWGARAIFKRSGPVIDLLPDRQSWHGEDRKPLVRWLNDTGIPALRDLCKDLTTCSGETVSHSEGGWTIEASPRESFGYLYLVAYPMNGTLREEVGE